MVNERTIRRKLDTLRSTRIVSSDKQVVVLMDATYWGWKFGLVIFKDARIDGVVCDGLRGMFPMLSRYKVQMCRFHQVKIVKKYLTNKPELEAPQELLRIAKFMSRTDKESFIGLFEEWIEKWSDFLKERTKDSTTGKTRYTHRSTRSAYFSLKRNMPYLWTWYDSPASCGIPNTNNELEGKFTDLKTKLRNHNGWSLKHKMTFIDTYLKGTYQ